MKSNELRILATNYAKLSKELLQASNTLLSIEKMQGLESTIKKQKTTKTQPGKKIKLSKKQISSNKNDDAKELINSINKMSENIGSASDRISKL